MPTGPLLNEVPTPNTQPTGENNNLTETNDDAQNPPETRQADDERAPTEKDFDIPTTKEAYESRVDRFRNAGLSHVEADEAIITRTTSYNRAC